jgi:DNA-binding NtrC family response regulator
MPGRKADVTGTILIVGDDPILLETRAHLLKAWRVSTTNSKHAVEEIQSKFYDLIIFCQTISDETAQTLIEQAHELNPTVKTLVVHRSGLPRNVTADPYEIQLQNPGRFISVVAGLLQSSDSHHIKR